MKLNKAKPPIIASFIYVPQVGTFWERSGQCVPIRGPHRKNVTNIMCVVITDDMQNARHIFDEVVMTDDAWDGTAYIL